MRDHRLPPFVWQGREAMARVRHCFAGRERTMAVAIYQAMTTLANDARGLSFNASRKDIAELAGVGVRSIDRYASAFERVGLVEIGRTDGEASSYTLTEADQVEPAQQPRTPRAAEAPPPAQQPRTPRLYEEEVEEGRTTRGDERPEQSQHEKDIDALWTLWCELFGDRMRVKDLTPPRSRSLSRALKASTLEVCMDAARAFHAWLKAHPRARQNVDPSRIYETGPHSSRNLTDQIESWAQQAGESLPQSARFPLDLSGMDPVTVGTVRHRRQTVRDMYENPNDEYAQRVGREFEEWLREKIGHKPVIVDGRVTGWDYA